MEQENKATSELSLIGQRVLISSCEKINNLLALGNMGQLVSNSDLTIEKIYEVNNECSVGYLVKQDKIESVKALYLLALKEIWYLCENNFTSEALASTVNLLISTYPEFRPQEIIVILKNGLVGKYGKCYGKASTMEVMRWALEYSNERIAFFENKIGKKDRDFADIDPKLLKNFKSIPKKELTDQEKELEAIRRESDRKSNEKYQIWIKEFDKLYAQKNDITVGIKFIFFSGQNMDLETFLKHKLKFA